MIEFKPKLWTGASVAILLAAGGAGLAACSGEGGEKGKAQAVGESGGEGGEAAASAAPVGEGGQGGGGEGGGGEGEAGGGEAGAQSAFAQVPADSRTALHVAHLKGFFLVAQKQTEGADHAAALAGQGLLEAFDPFKADFAAVGVNEAVLRKAAQTGSAADLKAAVAALDAAQKKAGGDPAAVAKGLVGIASGLYGHVENAGVVDPIEYQHSLGAALSAQRTVEQAPGSDKARAAKAEIDKLVRLWAAPQAPDKVAPKSQVLAQASRAELELS